MRSRRVPIWRAAPAVTMARPARAATRRSIPTASTSPPVAGRCCGPTVRRARRVTPTSVASRSEPSTATRSAADGRRTRDAQSSSRQFPAQPSLLSVFPSSHCSQGSENPRVPVGAAVHELPSVAVGDTFLAARVAGPPGGRVAPATEVHAVADASEPVPPITCDETTAATRIAGSDRERVPQQELAPAASPRVHHTHRTVGPPWCGHRSRSVPVSRRCTPSRCSSPRRRSPPLR